MIKLVIEDDEGQTTVVPLIRDEVTIGRKEGSTIRLTERNVSRRHARIVRERGALFIEDMGSYNGTLVNGARIAGRTPVAEGDRIQIGDYLLGLVQEAADEDEDVSEDALTRQVARLDPTDVDAPPGPDRAAVAGEIKIDDGRVRPQEPGRLVCLSSNFAGREFRLERPVTILGRTPDNDIVLDHRSISRHHARISHEDGRYVIVDMQSANGVRVNGDAYDRVELRNGDIIDLGHVRLRYVAPGAPFDFARDATIVDVSRLERRKGAGAVLWVALGALLIGAFGGGAWWFLRGRGGQRGQATAATAGGSAGSPATPRDGALSEKIVAAARAERWDEAVRLCGRLPATAPAEDIQRCKRARRERAAAAIYRRAVEAEKAGHHAQALALFQRVPEDSVYAARREGDPSYRAARDGYLTEARRLVRSLAASGACAQAEGKAAEVRRLVPAETEVDRIAQGCAGAEPTGAAGRPDAPVAPAAPAGRPASPPPARRSPGTRAVARAPEAAVKRPRRIRRSAPAPRKRAVVPAAPAAPAAVDPRALIARAQAAYAAGDFEQAASLARKALTSAPTNAEALRILGVAACALRRESQASWAYRRIGAKDRILLRNACFRYGITLE